MANNNTLENWEKDFKEHFKFRNFPEEELDMVDFIHKLLSTQQEELIGNLREMTFSKHRELGDMKVHGYHENIGFNSCLIEIREYLDNLRKD